MCALSHSLALQSLFSQGAKRVDEGFQATRCFVSGLSPRTDWGQLKDHFRDAGFKVVYASVSEDRHTGESKECGIVQFETDAEAVRAMARRRGVTHVAQRQIPSRGEPLFQSRARARVSRSSGYTTYESHSPFPQAASAARDTKRERSSEISRCRERESA